MGTTLDHDVELPTVQTVLAGGAADHAGILEGDLITAIDGTAVATIEELHKAIGTYAPGTKISVAVRRGNEELKLRVILDKPAVDENIPSPMARGRDSQLESLSSKGGKLSQRRRNFPLCIFNDTLLNSDECGGPLLDTDGKTVGIDIARTLRTRSLAIPAAEVQKAVTRIRSNAT
jgi:serine protease Do